MEAWLDGKVKRSLSDAADFCGKQTWLCELCCGYFIGLEMATQIR